MYLQKPNNVYSYECFNSEKTIYKCDRNLPLVPFTIAAHNNRANAKYIFIFANKIWKDTRLWSRNQEKSAVNQTIQRKVKNNTIASSSEVRALYQLYLWLGKLAKYISYLSANLSHW